MNEYRYVMSSPTSNVDPQGLDRYITNRFDGSIVQHVGIAVDVWWKDESGMYHKDGARTYHFAVDVFTCRNRNWITGPGFTLLAGQGIVVKHHGIDLKEGYFTMPSTPEQDAVLLQYLERQLKNPPVYSVLFHNCETWSKRAFGIGIEGWGETPNLVQPVGSF